jgi:hypothetical protein
MPPDTRCLWIIEFSITCLEPQIQVPKNRKKREEKSICENEKQKQNLFIRVQNRWNILRVTYVVITLSKEDSFCLALIS